MAIIKYFTFNTKTRDLVPLELPIAVDGQLVLHPSPAQAAQFAAYPINPSVNPPTPPEGKIAVPDSWEVVDGEWVRTWRWEDAPPPPPRRWSRLSIKTALAQAEMLAAARAYLSAVEIATGYTAWEALTDCDYIEEGFPTAERWGALLDGAATALGKTRAEIDAFWDAIPTGG
jgi:hypothetical protein